MGCPSSRLGLPGHSKRRVSSPFFDTEIDTSSKNIRQHSNWSIDQPSPSFLSSGRQKYFCSLDQKRGYDRTKKHLKSQVDTCAGTIKMVLNQKTGSSH